MSERAVSFVLCDLCGRRGPEAACGLFAAALAREKGWRVVAFDRYGNEGHVCPACAGGDADDVLVERILKRGETP